MVNERKGTPVNGVRSTRRDNINDINDIDGNQTWRTSTEPAVTNNDADEWERIDKREAHLDHNDNLLIERPAEQGDWTYVSQIYSSAWLARLRGAGASSKAITSDDGNEEGDANSDEDGYVTIHGTSHGHSNTEISPPKRPRAKKVPSSTPERYPKHAT